MSRPIWTGVVTMGLVAVPVGLYTATEDHSVHFHQLQRGTSDRIRNKRVNERTGREGASDDIVKGYDLGDGDYVIVEPDELDSIAPGRSKVIEMAGFVDLGEIAPVYFGRTYYLAPRGKEYVKVYQLLRTALERADKAGTATFTMRSKQYLTALGAQADVLVIHLLHWADEVRDPGDVIDLLPDRRTKADNRELKSAEQLIGALSVGWDPRDCHDTFEERVKELVEAKRKGEEVVSGAPPPDATNVIDLAEALRQSVEQAGAKSEGSRTGRQRTLSAHRTRHHAEHPKRSRTDRGSDALSSLSREELYRRATKADVPGRSKMNRDELIEALQHQPAA
ncbi:non-homologous end joining protein Ku [Streptomyces brasiliensis]|uniref:Non-homologous end joining protein Ku n=1 Tax=Streptomyces brasiliensis TaxID=1954 RepID=A0A917K042_9ACTN|nr:Ku protein [Streptomyces brasiliensis]GGI93945.1 non-homologous end joining protein Ku [Streptomyces brasiliensis]